MPARAPFQRLPPVQLVAVCFTDVTRSIGAFALRSVCGRLPLAPVLPLPAADPEPVAVPQTGVAMPIQRV